MPFDLLPNEILCEILALCGYITLKNAALVNKTIYRVATPYLKYRHVQIGWDDNPDYYNIPDDWPGHHGCSTTTSVEFLERIIKSPGLGSYVKTLSIAGTLNSWNAWTDHFDEARTKTIQAIVERLHGFENTFKASPYFNDEIASSVERTLQGDESSVVALLLTLLPHLETLWIWHDSYDMKAVERVVTKIAKETIKDLSAATPPRRPRHALGMLNTLNIIYCYPKGSENFTFLAAFALLPSMRRLNGDGLSGSDYDTHQTKCEHEEEHEVCPSSVEIWPAFYASWDPHPVLPETGTVHPIWQYPPSTSNVEALHLSRSAISDFAMESFLPAFKNLKSFHYNAGGPLIGFDELNLGYITALLSKKFQNSLEELHLGRGEDQSDALDPDHTLGSILTRFSKLREVKLDVRLLLEEDVDSLVILECLPSSLEILKLEEYDVSADPRPLERLFCDFSREWRANLPKLREIQLETDYINSEEFIEELGAETGLLTQIWTGKHTTPFPVHKINGIIQDKE